MAILSASVIAPLAASGDAALFSQLTVGLAILVGAMFVVAGLVKLGFLADFMSRPVLDGFIVGLAMTVGNGTAPMPRSSPTSVRHPEHPYAPALDATLAAP